MYRVVTALWFGFNIHIKAVQKTSLFICKVGLDFRLRFCTYVSIQWKIWKSCGIQTKALLSQMSGILAPTPAHQISAVPPSPWQPKMSHRNISACGDTATPLENLWSGPIRSPLFGVDWGGCLSKIGILLARRRRTKGSRGDPVFMLGLQPSSFS